jgi:glycine/D-amino acid oxidase-like deaminating enzyme
MRVTVLPRDDATNGWTTILPPPPPARTYSGESRADVVVVGAGLAGLAAARRAAELDPASRVVVLEAQRVAACSSGRNSGFLIDLPHESESMSAESLGHQQRVLRLNRFAARRLKELVSTRGIACEWAEQGMYRGAVTEEAARYLDPYETMIRQLGIPCERLSRDEIRRRIGTSLYCDAVWSPGTVLLQPAALVRGLAACLPANVELYELSPVVRLDRQSGIVVETPGGVLRAGRLILAVNGLLPAFGFMRGRLINLGLWASVTRPLAEGELARLGTEGNWGMTPADARGGITMRLLASKRLLVRATTYAEQRYRPHTERHGAVADIHRRILERRFPDIAPISIEHTWTGFVSKTWNSAPVFGELAPGVYSACVQNGVGLARGTYQGELAADLMMGNRHALVEDMLAHERPTSLPPEPFTTWGARLRIAWLERQSRRER